MLKTTTKKPLGTAGANETNLTNPQQPYSIESIPIQSIIADELIQQRAVILNDIIVAEYAEGMKAGATFPPCIVYRDRFGILWLSDGFHRVEAARKAGLTEIPAEVREGSLRDATLFACAANKDHGLRRNRDDVRRAISTLVKDHEWGLLSDRAIAEKVGCSDKTVASVRKDLGRCGNSAPQDPPTPQPVSEAMKGDDLSGMPQATAMIKCEAPPPPANRTGRDGKSYPAPKAKPAPKPAPPPTKPTPPPAPTKPKASPALVAMQRAHAVKDALVMMERVEGDLLPDDAVTVLCNLRTALTRLELRFGRGYMEVLHSA